MSLLHQYCNEVKNAPTSLGQWGAGRNPFRPIKESGSLLPGESTFKLSPLGQADYRLGFV